MTMSLELGKSLGATRRLWGPGTPRPSADGALELASVGGGCGLLLLEGFVHHGGELLAGGVRDGGVLGDLKGGFSGEASEHGVRVEVEEGLDDIQVAESAGEVEGAPAAAVGLLDLRVRIGAAPEQGLDDGLVLEVHKNLKQYLAAAVTR